MDVLRDGIVVGVCVFRLYGVGELLDGAIIPLPALLEVQSSDTRRMETTQHVQLQQGHRFCNDYFIGNIAWNLPTHALQISLVTRAPVVHGTHHFGGLADGGFGVSLRLTVAFCLCTVLRAGRTVGAVVAVVGAGWSFSTAVFFLSCKYVNIRQTHSESHRLPEFLLRDRLLTRSDALHIAGVSVSILSPEILTPAALRPEGVTPFPDPFLLGELGGVWEKWPT